MNAFQRLSQVVIQKSIREGFGLVVSEAMWKSTPVVAGRAGGIPLQMADGVGGVLVDSPEECASAVRNLLRDPDHAQHLAHSGRERVQRQFLLPRLLLNELRLMKKLGGAGVTREESWKSRRDPVCGMMLSAGYRTATIETRTFQFCSELCQNQFLRAPERYLSVRT